MHRTTKRLASALLAAALCFAAALPAGADYEPWTYEVDDVMSSYGVEYYGDVGLEAPTRSTGTASYSSGVSTYSAADAQPVDTGLGYTTTQLPGGITLYTPTDDAVSTYAMGADDGYGVAEYAVTNGKPVYGYDGSDQIFSVTVPATVQMEGTNAETLTISGTVQPYNTLQIGVQAKSDSTLKNPQLVSDGGNGSYSIDYSITLGNTRTRTTSGGNWTTDKGSEVWNDTMSTALSTLRFEKDLTVQITDENALNNLPVSGSYEDTLTFVLDGQRKTYNVVYHNGDATKTETYRCGSTDKLAAASGLGFTAASDDENFLGWATWEDSSTTSTKNIYAEGISLAVITESKVRNAYVGSDSDGVMENGVRTVHLYAKWTNSNDTTKYSYNADIYYENANVKLSASTSLPGNGITEHNYGKDSNGNYVYYTLKESNATLSNIPMQLVVGQTYYWTLQELKDYGVSLTLTDDNYYDPYSAARVTVNTSDDGTTMKLDVLVNRRLVCLDLNGILAKLNDEPYINNGNFKDSGVQYAKITDVTVAGTSYQPASGSDHDYWSLHAYGQTASVTVEVIDSASKTYLITGYKLSTESKRVDVTPCKEITISGIMLTPTITASVSSNLSVIVYVKEVEPTSDSTDTVTLLPELDMSRPVAITQPDAADTTTDAADDTVTPDDLMITDADEMLTTLDAAFAVPDFDPVY